MEIVDDFHDEEQGNPHGDPKFYEKVEGDGQGRYRFKEELVTMSNFFTRSPMKMEWNILPPSQDQRFLLMDELLSQMCRDVLLLILEFDPPVHFKIDNFSWNHLACIACNVTNSKNAGRIAGQSGSMYVTKTQSPNEYWEVDSLEGMYTDGNWIVSTLWAESFTKQNGIMNKKDSSGFQCVSTSDAAVVLLESSCYQHGDYETECNWNLIETQILQEVKMEYTIYSSLFIVLH